MTQMLKLSVRELRIIMANMLRVLMEKVEKMKEQMGSVSRETETLRNQKEIPEIKNSNGKDECL